VASTVTAVNWDGENGIDQKIAVGAHTKVRDGGFNPTEQGNTTRPLGLSFLSVRADRDLNPGLSKTPSAGTSTAPVVPETPAADASNAASAGSTSAPLSTGYLLPFEIVSVHLLVVLVGAAYLARTKRRVTT